jgi:hypothetical protein
VSVLRELAVKLGLDVDESSFAAGELAAKAVEKGLEEIVEIAKEVVEAFVDMAKEAIEYAEEIDHTSQAIGLGIDALQEWLYVGKLAGVGAEEMSQSFGLLSRNILAASKGAKEQSELFSSLKIKVKDADGTLRGADDILADVADKFAEMPDGVKKTGLALELFGRAGKRMIPLLNEGSDGLEELRQEARDLGVVMSDEAIKQGTEVADNVKRLQAMWDGIKNKAGSTLFPILKQLTDGMIDWVKANKEIIAQRLGQVLNGIARAARLVLDVFDVLAGTFRLLRDIVGAVLNTVFLPFIGALELLWDMMGPKLRAIAIGAAISFAVMVAPITAIIAGVGLLLLVLNSIQRWREGKDSLFGDWMKQLDDWRKPNKDDVWFVVAIKKFLDYSEMAINRVRELYKMLTDAPSAKEGLIKIAEAGPLGFVVKAYERGQESDANGGDIVDKVKAIYNIGGGGAQPYTPTLPSGQGVMRGGSSVMMAPSFTIYQAPGMSPVDVADAVQTRLDEVHESALAALGD